MTPVMERLQTALADRYQLNRELDTGGMALVYVARDLRHDRGVAIKVLRPELSAVLGGERFLGEIRITAHLQHPHVLPLFDSGSADGLLFYVMPYVEGESLRARLNRERQFSIEEAVRIAAQVASALDYAHRHKVIHRDIKPENILLQDGEVLVADFGIALAVQQAAGSRLTETGLSLGTPQYMSPEQATGDRQIDGRTDIYSLGAVLYEMLAGEPPYTGPSVQAIIAKVLTERPRPLAQLRETVPPHVAAAVDRALARLPADRFAHPTELAAALLQPEASGLQVAASPTMAPSIAPPSRALRAAGRRAAMIAVGSAIGVAIGIMVGRLWRSASVAEPVRFTVEVGSPQIDQLLGQLPLMALSPNGRALVFSQDGLLRIRELNNFTSTPLPGTEGAVAPAFSPDGRWLVFGQRGRMRKTAVTGGPIVDIAPANFRLGAFWAEDGNIYFSAGLGDRGIWRVPAASGRPEQVTQLSTTVIEQAHGWPQVLPGARDLLFTVLGPSGGAEDSRVVVETMGSGERTTLVEHATFGRYLSTGHLLYGTRDGAVFAVSYDPTHRRVTGTPTPVLDGVTVGVWGGGLLFAVSNQGTLAYVPGTATENHIMRLVDRAGSEVRVIGPPRTIRQATFSPDGQRIAATVTEPSRIDIWLFKAASGESERFTLAPEEDEHPVWSPDGRTIMYTSAWSGQARHLFAKSVAERTDPRLIRTWWRHIHLRSWSRDGKWLAAYDYHPVNNEDVWVIAAQGSDSIPIATSAAAELNPVFSPDGRWLAYQSDQSGRFEVYVVSFPARTVQRQVSTNGGRIPRWDPSGEALCFLENDRLMTVPLGTRQAFELRGTPTLLFKTAAFDYDIAPDARQFLLLLPNPQAPVSSIHVVVNWFSELASVSARASPPPPPVR